MPLRDRRHDLVLRKIRILEFIDHHVGISLTQPPGEFVVLIEQRGHMQQQVVEVDAVGIDQSLLILGIDLGHDGLQMVANFVLVLGEPSLRSDQVVLRLADHRADDFGRIGR